MAESSEPALDLAELKAAWEAGRRRFLAQLAAGSGVAVLGGLAGCSSPAPAPPAAPAPTPTPGAPAPAREWTAVTTCNHNCGGRCVLHVHVKDGVIRHITSDDGRIDGRPYGTDTVDVPQLRACLRGRAYRALVHHPERLTRPLLRTGERGSGQFREASWDEALDLVATRLNELKAKHGPESVFAYAGTGSRSLLNNGGLVKIFLALTGGFSTYWSSYSYEGAHFSQEMTLGSTRKLYGEDFRDGSESDDFLNSKLILLWGWDPASSISETNTPYYLTLARERGARIIAIDPVYTESAAAFAERWIPIRPGSDAAMLLAMAQVMFEEGLEDKPYVARHVHGAKEYRDYLDGKTDGVRKDPRWAEGKTGVPAADIADLARTYARERPGALVHAWAPGRTARGEQYHRAAHALQALTGNIGVTGGYAGGSQYTKSLRVVSVGEFMINEMLSRGLLRRPVEIMGDRFAEAVLKGVKADPRAIGLRGHDRLPAPIRAVYGCASNFFNQMQNLNRMKQAMRALDFAVVHDCFLTPTARWCDVVLPSSTFMERDDISDQWLKGRHVIVMQKAIAPLGESKSDFEIFAALSQRMGLPWMFGRSAKDCLTGMLASSEIPDKPLAIRSGLSRLKRDRPWVAYRECIEQPERYPFQTYTGKIEILSTRLQGKEWQDAGFRRKIPALPTWEPAFEDHDDPLARRFPLQAITAKNRHRVHSTQVLNPWLRELERHEMWLNAQDASKRGIADGDRVRVFNDRGAMLLQAKVTERIRPGVVKLWEGMWYDPAPDGADRGGNPNVLTRDEPSAAGSYPFSTLLVEVAKA